MHAVWTSPRGHEVSHSKHQGGSQQKDSASWTPREFCDRFQFWLGRWKWHEFLGEKGFKYKAKQSNGRYLTLKVSELMTLPSISLSHLLLMCPKNYFPHSSENVITCNLTCISFPFLRFLSIWKFWEMYRGNKLWVMLLWFLEFSCLQPLL